MIAEYEIVASIMPTSRLSRENYRINFGRRALYAENQVGENTTLDGVTTAKREEDIDRCLISECRCPHETVDNRRANDVPCVKIAKNCATTFWATRPYSAVCGGHNEAMKRVNHQFIENT